VNQRTELSWGVSSQTSVFFNDRGAFGGEFDFYGLALCPLWYLGAGLSERINGIFGLWVIRTSQRSSTPDSQVYEKVSCKTQSESNRRRPQI
jgi:hypothetical protein